MKDCDSRPAVGGWAPGEYFCRCQYCKLSYAGDKRSWQCADCAYEIHEATHHCGGCGVPLVKKANVILAPGVTTLFCFKCKPIGSPSDLKDQKTL